METNSDEHEGKVPDREPIVDSMSRDDQVADVIIGDPADAGKRSRRKNPAKGKDAELVGVDQTVDMGLTAYLEQLRLLEANVEVPIESIEPFDIRDKGSDKAKIHAYAQSMMDEIEFPNVILLRDKDNTLRMADGNHRTQAAVIAGKKTIRADIYEGGIIECIDIGLAANRHGNGLKPQDIVRAHVMKYGKDQGVKEINISDLSRKTGVCRQTIRKYIGQATTGYANMARKIKLPKSDEEKAQELAGKVIRMVDEGNPQVIQFVFHGLSPYTRGKILSELGVTFADDAANI